MTKSALIILMILVSLVIAEDSSVRLEVGMKAPEWVFQDADGKEFTMDFWKGKIIQINYVDPDESEMNEAFNDAVKKVIEVDSLISRDKFEGFGIYRD